MNSQRPSNIRKLGGPGPAIIVAILTLLVAVGSLLNDLSNRDQSNANLNNQVTIPSNITEAMSQNPTIGAIVTITATLNMQLESTLAVLTDDRSESTMAPVQATVTPQPTGLSVPTQVLLKPTVDIHSGEVNLFESNKSLPAGWFTNGQYTYWEGFLRVQDELFIDITVANCGDDEGNGRLDIIQIFYPDGTLAVNKINVDGDPKYRVRTYLKPGYYRIFLQDNDTGGKNGNGGTLSVEMLKDQTMYRNLP